MRAKIPDLSMALEGRFGDHHALMCRLHLDHIDHLEAMITRLEAQIEAMMTPFRAQRDLLATAPGIGQLAAAGVICEIGADVRGVLRHRRAPGLLDRAVPRQPRIRRETPLRQAPPRQRAPAVPPGGVRLVRGPPRRLPQIPLPPARHEMGRLPQPGRQEESHHRGRPRPGRHHLAHPGHRKALPGTRRRLLHHAAWTPNAKPAASSPSSKPSDTPSPSSRRLTPAPRTRLR